MYEKLIQNRFSDMYPYHMPGHKRNMEDFPMAEYYGIDITEIDGFDNLHHPQGILKNIMKQAAQLFGAETYLLVNGSTCGILSAVSAALRRGDTLLMARNCHKSVWHAAYLRACKIRYVYPACLEHYGICGAVSAEDMERCLCRYPEIRAVLLTSPTYDGVVSDVARIVGLAHDRGIPVIVDEAHGAHFSLDARFPKSAIDLGADLVIHSIHKTLPALTQTALLHVQGNLVDRDRLCRFLGIYQTSSPSYILLAGIEQCLAVLEEKGTTLCETFFRRNTVFEKRMMELQHLHILSAETERFRGNGLFDFDTGKKIISTAGTQLRGTTLYDLLRSRYGLQMEMAGQTYVTAIMTIMDSEAGFTRLADALGEIDGMLSGSVSVSQGKAHDFVGGFAASADLQAETAAYTVYEAIESEQEMICLEECQGRAAGEWITVYPPGIPLIVPGEIFTETVIGKLLYCRGQGFTIEGMRDDNRKVCVVRKEIYA